MTELNKLIINIGDNLRKLRIQKGLSQKEVADLMGVATTQYGRIENGKTTPTIASLFKVSKALKVNIRTFIGPLEIADQDIKDKTILEKAKMLEELGDEDRKAIFRIIELAAKQKKFSEIFNDFKK
ncbi:MAG: helix-turn-helix domain-containing protein [Flavobacteriales bacterium]|jgi:transcriptional regulator with XRE-family HTH domain